MNKEVIDFLAMIGVDTRYISLYKKSIFINNLKFSRFSHRREELFLAKHPDYQIIRSKIFQKMCIRASRYLSKCLNPGEKILIHKNGTCSSLILYLILEPYQRKYGIKIIHDDSLEYTTDNDVDSVASSITLDQEVGNLIKKMFEGRKIELTSIKTVKEDRNDHAGNILLLPYQPTSENMLSDFVERLKRSLPEGIRLVSMRLRETATSYAEWFASDNQ